MDELSAQMRFIAKNLTSPTQPTVPDKCNNVIQALGTSTFKRRKEAIDLLCKEACTRFNKTEDQLFADLDGMYGPSHS